MSKHKVISNIKYSTNCFELTLERNNINYNPGSCASINGKTYSFCSSPNDENTIKFIIRHFTNGYVSNMLYNANVNTTIEIDDIFTFFYPGACNTPYCYIATGTGIAPFLSALQTYEHKPNTILYGAKTYDDLYNLYYLKDICTNVYVAVSQSEFVHNNAKRVTDLLDKLPIDDNMTYYLCGIENMITDMSKYLTDKGISFKNIQQEMFYMSL